MIRVGSLKAGLDRFAGTLRGVRDGMLGTAYVTITPTPDTRREGGTNTAVLARLVERNPDLAQGMDPAARKGAKRAWSRGVRTLATLHSPTIIENGSAVLRKARSALSTKETGQ